LSSNYFVIYIFYPFYVFVFTVILFLSHLLKINYHKQYVRAPRKIPETYAKKQLPAMSKQTMSKELFNFL